MARGIFFDLGLGLIAAVLLLVGVPIYQKVVVLGILRGEVSNIHGAAPLRHIPDTVHCADIHHEKTTNTLFAACQDDPAQRGQWFPPAPIITNPGSLNGGSIVRIDPETFTSTKLKFDGFSGPFITHGIDILNDPHDPQTLWIYAVNHLPNPDRWENNIPNAPPARSQIEVFKHALGSDAVSHIRSVRHPLIRTPNDILAVSPMDFYVTDDHVYFDGVGRMWEDVGMQIFAPASKTIHVSITDMTTSDPDASVDASVALHVIHNNSGLGRAHPALPQEINIVDASGGVMGRVVRNLDKSAPGGSNLTVMEMIQFDTTLDNPSYYEDLYVTPGNNASGYIIPGLPKAFTVLGDVPYPERAIPSCVWYLHPKQPEKMRLRGKNDWEKLLIFQDDGSQLRSASGAVMVGIDPKKNGGKKQAWLFVTGFASSGVVAAKIDL